MGRGKIRVGFCKDTLRKRTTSKPKFTWENNIKMNLKVIEWEGEDRIIRAQDRQVVGFCENGNEPPGFVTCME
jgi:hypothetical protein